MSALLTPPVSAVTPTPVVSPPSPPKLFRWTIAQYRELGSVLGDQKTMLIDGEIYRMPPPKPPHDVALALTDAWLRTVFAAGHFVRGQMGFDVGEDSDPSPDLAVVVGSIRDHLHATPREAVLVVEAAESSLAFDTTTKVEKYATAKVPEYWVIDVTGRQLIVFRDPAPLPAALGANAYRQRTTYNPTDTISPLAASHASVTVSDLLP